MNKTEVGKNCERAQIANSCLGRRFQWKSLFAFIIRQYLTKYNVLKIDYPLLNNIYSLSPFHGSKPVSCHLGREECDAACPAHWRGIAVRVDSIDLLSGHLNAGPLQYQ